MNPLWPLLLTMNDCSSYWLSTAKRLASRRPHARSSPTARCAGRGISSSTCLNASRPSAATKREPRTTSSSGKAINARWYASCIRPFNTWSRLEVRLTLISPSSTHGVPPMRSSVEKVKPCSLPSMRATVHNTQSSLALDNTPMSNAPPIDAISSRSVSVSAAQSRVSTWLGIAPIVKDFADATAASRVLQHHGVVAEGNAQLADHHGEVDAELVGDADHLAVADVQHDRRVAWVVAQDLAQLVDAQLVERRGRQLEVQRRCVAAVEVLDHLDVLGHEPDTALVALVEAALHRDDLVVEQLVAVLHQRAREHRHLHRTAEVLQREDGHLVALLGELARQTGDHPADGEHAPVLAVERLGHRAVDLAAQRRLGAEQRVVADVQAEHLLLELQPVALVELVLGDGDALGEAAVLAGEHVVAEQAHHALVAFAPAHQCRVDDLLEDHQQAAARMVQVVERTGLDQ